MAPAKDCRAAVHRELRRAAVMLQLLWENIDRYSSNAFASCLSFGRRALPCAMLVSLWIELVSSPTLTPDIRG